MSRQLPAYSLRVQPELLESLKREAAKNHRSLNGEIAFQLERQLADTMRARRDGMRAALRNPARCHGIVNARAHDDGVERLPRPPSEDFEFWRTMDRAPKTGMDVVLWVIHPADDYATSAGAPGGWEGCCVGRWNDVTNQWEGSGMLAGEIVRWRPYLARPHGLPPMAEAALCG